MLKSTTQVWERSKKKKKKKLRENSVKSRQNAKFPENEKDKNLNSDSTKLMYIHKPDDVKRHGCWYC